MKAVVVGSGLDPMGDMRPLGCDNHIGHAFTIDAVWITPEISFELVTEAVPV